MIYIMCEIIIAQRKKDFHIFYSKNRTKPKKFQLFGAFYFHFFFFLVYNSFIFVTFIHLTLLLIFLLRDYFSHA